MATFGYDINRSLLAGNDLQLNFGLLASPSEELMASESGKTAMRQATKNVLYMVANSDAPVLYQPHMFTITKIILVADLILAALFILFYFRRFMKMKKWKGGTPVA